MEPQLFLISDTTPAADGEAIDEAAQTAGWFATHTPANWRLDDRTRTLGHQGIARARAALQRATGGAAGVPARRPAA